MRARTDYKKCPYCDASLDVGERCDCRDDKPVIVRVERPKKVYGNNLTAYTKHERVQGRIRAF